MNHPKLPQQADAGDVGIGGVDGAPLGLAIRDRPGVIPAETIREWFERAIRDTPILKGHGLSKMTRPDGSFWAYRDGHVNRLWIGFAVGVRCAERLLNAREWPSP